MTDSQWISWFFYTEPWWLAPVRIFAYFLFVTGVIIVGLAKRNIKYLSFGIALFIYVAVSIYISHIDIHNFFRLDLLVVKILYGIMASVIIVILTIACKIKRGIYAATKQKEN
jgi:hypothetical protein